MTESNLQKWGSFDLAALERQEQQIRQKEGKAGSFWKPSDGKNVIRFLPQPVGVDSPFQVVYQHFITLADKRIKAFYCPAKMGNAFCPSCEKSQALRSNLNNPIDRTNASNFGWRFKVMANIIDRADPEAGPKIWSFPAMVWKPLKQIMHDDETSSIIDPTEKGFDIIVNRAGEHKNTTYTVRPERKNSPLGLDFSVLDQQHNLADLVVMTPPETVMAWMRGESAEVPAEKIDKPPMRTLNAKKTPTIANDIYEVDDDDDVPY